MALVALAAAVPGGAAPGGVSAPPPQPPRSPQEPGDARLHRPVHYDDLRALRSFFERVDVSSVAADLPVPRAATSRAMGAVLAGLPADWGAPFAFVQGAVRYVPYSGSVRGAEGALESGAGNALDQALLLRGLMDARGIRTRLARGRLDWSDAARLVLGTSSPAAPQPDDPWPRWLETAADHWWVQAERDDSWVDLDPSFSDSAIGTAVGRDPRPYDAPPDELVATLRVELVRGALVLAEAALTAPEAVGHGVALRFAAKSREAFDLWGRVEGQIRAQASWMARVARAFGAGAGPQPVTRPTAETLDGVSSGPANPDGPRLQVPPRRPRPSVVQRLFLDPDAGPWMARLQLPGRVLEAGPFERSDLDAIAVRLRVTAPQAPEHVMEVPWGGGAEGRLAVLVAAGTVADERLAGHARAMYAAVNRIASAEQGARVDMRPPIDYGSAADELGAAARSEWEAFAATVPETLAWVLLRGVDGVSDRSSAARVVRPGLRFAAVRWRPPADAADGALELQLSDSVTVGQLTGEASLGALRAAYGLLQSAVISQVLNRLTERAPETAFDITLRAVGTAERLLVLRPAAALPDGWPVATRAGAAEDLRAGYAVVAPASFGNGGAGWWSVAVADGETTGWVPGPQAPLHGRVTLGTVGRHDDLEALLASLPALHRALRWLAELRGSGPTSLTSVPQAACASAMVAAEVMAATVPPDWPRPDVPALCGAG